MARTPSGFPGAKIPKGYSFSAIPRFTPQQNRYYEGQLGQLQNLTPQAYSQLGALSQGNPETFSQLEAPALTQFHSQIVPQLAQRFSQGGTLKSSNFQNAALGAGANLAENLQAQRFGIQQGALDRLLGLEQTLLSQSPYEYGLAQKQRKPKWWEGLLGPAGQAVTGAGQIYSANRLGNQNNQNIMQLMSMLAMAA